MCVFSQRLLQLHLNKAIQQLLYAMTVYNDLHLFIYHSNDKISLWGLIIYPSDIQFNSNQFKCKSRTLLELLIGTSLYLAVTNEWIKLLMNRLIIWL